MNKEEKIRFAVITLIIACLFELFLIVGCFDLLNDKNDYILNQSQEKQEVLDTYEELLEKYADKTQKLNDYERRYGDLND